MWNSLNVLYGREKRGLNDGEDYGELVEATFMETLHAAYQGDLGVKVERETAMIITVYDFLMHMGGILFDAPDRSKNILMYSAMGYVTAHLRPGFVVFPCSGYSARLGSYEWIQRLYLYNFCIESGCMYKFGFVDHVAAFFYDICVTRAELIDEIHLKVPVTYSIDYSDTFWHCKV